MYEMVKRLYTNGQLTEAGLDSAIVRGWITAEQKKEIMRK